MQSAAQMVHNHQGRIITQNQSNNSFNIKPGEDGGVLSSQREKYKKSSLNSFNDRLKKSTSKCQSFFIFIFLL